MLPQTQLQVIDADVFIASHNGHYAPDICPGFWECLPYFYEQGNVISIDLVRGEIQDPPELVQWAANMPSGFFAPTSDRLIADSHGEIMNWVDGNPQFYNSAKREFADGADVWLIAYAMANNAVVVTNETFKEDVKRRVPIPNVCQQFGISYRNASGMLRELGARFEWRPPP